MRYKEVAKIIKSIGIPFAYRTFDNQTQKAPPFIVYFYDGYDDLYADNINYQTIAGLRIELYTTNKDFALEATVESALKSNGIAYAKDEIFIEDQNVYEIVYESEVVING